MKTKVMKTIALLRVNRQNGTYLFRKQLPIDPISSIITLPEVQNVKLSQYNFPRIQISYLTSAFDKISAQNVTKEKNGLNIDNKIFITVPTDRIETLYNFINDTKKGLTVFVNGFDYNKISSVLGIGTYAATRIEEFAKTKVENATIDKLLSLSVEFKQTLNGITGWTAIASKFHSNDICMFREPDNYWDEIDVNFIKAIGVDQVVYANGSYPTSTAGNTTGFNQRKSGGKTAGRDILRKVGEDLMSIDHTTPIDIVCHSMGFAYALGIIETLQGAGYKIGWVYYIAPENPSAGTMPINIDGVWQYGSDEINQPAWAQDLIAPQRAIGGLTETNRVYIPDTELGKWTHYNGFYNAHLVKNYQWIFTQTQNQKGNVHKR